MEKSTKFCSSIWLVLMIYVVILLPPEALTFPGGDDDGVVITIHQNGEMETTTVDPIVRRNERRFLRQIKANKNRAIFDTTMCGSVDENPPLEAFNFDKLNSPTFSTECSDQLAQQNGTASLAESVWLFVECLTYKGLEGKPLSLKNFARLMVANLTEDRRIRILSSLEKFDGGAKTFKEIWTKYFDAEFRECTNAAKYAHLLVQDPQLSQRWLKNVSVWAPEIQCGDRSAPHVKLVNFDRDYNHLKQCEDTLMVKYGLNGSESMQYPLMTTCDFMSAGLIKESDLHVSWLPLEEIFDQKFVPRYWPLAARNGFMEALNEFFQDRAYNIQKRNCLAAHPECTARNPKKDVGLTSTEVKVKKNLTFRKTLRKLRRQAEEILDLDPKIDEPTHFLVNMKLTEYAYLGMRKLMKSHCEFMEKF